MKHVINVLLLCVTIRVQGAKLARQAQYPRFERSCYRNMPASELNDCLKFNFQQNVPRFRSGIPGMMNESIDPLYWPIFETRFGGGLLSGKVKFENINFYGWSDLKILKVRSNVKDPQKMIFDIDWLLPKMNCDGRYKSEGRIGGLKFEGDGPFTINMSMHNFQGVRFLMRSGR